MAEETPTYLKMVYANRPWSLQILCGGFWSLRPFSAWSPDKMLIVPKWSPEVLKAMEPSRPDISVLEPRGPAFFSLEP